MKKAFFILFTLLFLPFLSKSQEVIPLKATGSENWDWQEKEFKIPQVGDRIIYNVTKPTLTVYLPDPLKATGTAMIIAPGGAFHILSYDNEGVEVAKWLNSRGIAAFVLKYRVGRLMTDNPFEELSEKMKDFKTLDETNAKVIPLALQDGLEAVKYVRQNAPKYEIDPRKIGFMGFSAGGTLTMSVVYSATDESRPNFVAPIYAYENAIIGKDIPKAKTPIFLAVAGDDQLGFVPHSINIYDKWMKAGQPAELHIYEKGGHGFGMAKRKIPTDTWYERFGDWMKMQGYLKKLRPNKYEKLYGEDAVEEGKKQTEKRNTMDYGLLEKYKAANASIPPPKKEENRVVFLGDSITEGWVNNDSEFFTQNNYIGRGISGQTSSQLLLRFRQDVINLKPKAVIINIGTNDIAENTGKYDLDFTMGNIKSMIELARANQIKVMLASVHPATAFQWRLELGDRSDMIVELNENIKNYAKINSIPYIDYHAALKNDKNGMNTDLAEDGVHPTLKAYKIMEALADNAIKTVLKKKK